MTAPLIASVEDVLRANSDSTTFFALGDKLGCCWRVAEAAVRLLQKHGFIMLDATTITPRGHAYIRAAEAGWPSNNNVALKAALAKGEGL